MYTIYRHLNKINGKSYIGQTKFQNLELRWQNGRGYYKQTQPCFRDAINKYGWGNFEHIILETNIPTKKEANIREKYWIAYYHTWVKDPLCNGYNLTPGGDDHTYNAKRVLQLNEDKEILAEYLSLLDAEDKTGIYAKNIYRACTKKIKSAGGYYWCYKDNYNTFNLVKSKKLKAKKAVCKIDFTNNLISIFNTMVDAAKSVNGVPSKISLCCNKLRKTAYGYYWCYKEDYKNFISPVLNKAWKSIPIIQLDFNGNYIYKFGSILEAARQLALKINKSIHAISSDICLCCKGKYKIARGYRWMYLEEWEKLQNEKRESTN